MPPSTDNLPTILAKLTAWREHAAKNARPDDAAVLAETVRIVQDAAIARVPRQNRAASDRFFVPSGTRLKADRAECCPWTHSGGCPNCHIDRPYPFAIADIPGRAFVCLTYLRAYSAP